MPRALLGALAIAAFAAASLETAQNTAAALPPRFERYLTGSARLTADERRALLGGTPVTKLLAADETTEVAVFGAIWIDAPMDRYVEAVKDSGAGFWFVTVNRSRSDGLSGFTGMFVRRRVRSEVEDGALASLQSTKRLLAGSR